MFLVDILQTRFKKKRTDAFPLMLGMNSEDREGYYINQLPFREL